MRRWLSVLLVLLIPTLAEAGTYWVSPTGDAAWASCQSATALSGTSACKLETALNNVVSGDTVWMRGGTYTQGIIVVAKNGTAGSRITFAAYSGETPEIRNTTLAYGTYYYGLLLRQSSYVVVRGITFVAVSPTWFVSISFGSHHNEIDDCVFNGNYPTYAAGAKFSIWTGTTWNDTANASTHNWIHDSSIINMSYGIQVGNWISGHGENVSGYNTFDRVTFAHGGHHVFESYSKNNVIRDSNFHNEGWRDTGEANWGPDSNGKYGDRNIQIYDGNYDTGMFNLLEGNRFGPSGPGANDDGGDGFTLTAPKNILRYNDIFGAQNNGFYFKSALGTVSDNNRIYNNTIFASGRFRNSTILTTQWQGYNVRMAGVYGTYSIASIEGVSGTVTVTTTTPQYFAPGSLVTIGSTTNYNVSNATVLTTPTTSSFTYAKSGSYAAETYGTATGKGPERGNSVINNIIRVAGTGTGDWDVNAGFGLVNTVTNNYCTTTSTYCVSFGDPKFVSTGFDAFAFSLTAPNLALQSDSPAINAGTNLTLANGSGNASTTLIVDDALFFQDGTWGSDLTRTAGVMHADWIAVGTVGNVAQISAINYDTNTITLASALTWADNDKVWLYKKSDGSVVLAGSAPDIGAHEFGVGTAPTAPTNVRVR